MAVALEGLAGVSEEDVLKCLYTYTIRFPAVSLYSITISIVTFVRCWKSRDYRTIVPRKYEEGGGGGQVDDAKAQMMGKRGLSIRQNKGLSYKVLKNQNGILTVNRIAAPSAPVIYPSHPFLDPNRPPLHPPIFRIDINSHPKQPL